MSERAVSMAPSAAVSQGQRGGVRERSATRLFAFVLAVCALGLILGNGDSLLRFSLKNWEGMLLWGSILLVVNLFPIHVGELTLTLDMPILLAMAILYPPEVAASLAIIASVDVREFSGQINPTRATYNRAQIGLSVFLAGLAFRLVAPQFDPWLIALSATGVSLVAFHIVNVLLVSCATTLRTQRPISVILRQMIVGDWREFLPTYFGFGALALVLAFVYMNLGGWSVVLFLAPLLVARQALVKQQRLQRLAQRLKERESLLQRLFDRMADERKDERTRIACDLHDDVLQSLIRISQLGGFIEKESDPPPQLSSDLQELADLAKNAAETVRRVIRGLDTSGVGRGGLVPTLSGLVRDLETRWRLKINLDILLVGVLPSSVELCAYQIAREALENAVRYSRASEIRVGLTEVDGELHVTVFDNGVGFDPTRVDKTSHFGLGMLEARAHLAGGTLRVGASAGTGTKIEAHLPLKKARPEELSPSFSGPD
jgi:signal transduction histidine kinase